MIGRTVSHFKVIERLDRGGMGVVYVGEDTRLGRPVALKFLSPHLSSDETAKSRFIREAKAASSLNHPHICTIYEIGETDDEQLFIAMALYEGQTLKARLEKEAVTVEDAVLIAAQVADGLTKAHEKGILHRDIKPGNVFMTDHGEAVILDFGLAKLSGAVELTTVGKTLGTAAYMSPEQMRGEEIGAASDVWSLGVMLYEMLAGRRPFAGEYEQALAYAILNVDPPPLEASPHLPDGIIAIVNRCLAKDPRDRFASAEEVRKELQHFVPGSGRSSGKRAPTFGLAARSTSMLKSRRLWILPALLAATLILVILLWYQLSGPRGETQLIAVLPFSVIGDTQHGEDYAAGLRETLASRLSSRPFSKGRIGVIPASEIGDSMTAAQARKEMGATMAVTGSVQFRDERTRLTLSLIDTKTPRTLDSRLVDNDRTSPLALQDQALLLVADMLNMELDPSVRDAVTASSSSNRFANDFYVRARGLLRKGRSLDDVDAAISLFEQAVSLDSTYAVAIAGLGEAYWERYRQTEDVQWADKAIELSNRALRVDDSQERVYITLGTIYSGRRMHGEAQKAFDKAIELNPTDADIYIQRGSAWRSRDRPDLAESDYRLAIALEPGWRGHAYLGSLYFGRGQYERALTEWRRGLDLAPENLGLLANVGAAYFALEKPEQAVAAFKEVLATHPDHERAKQNLGTAYFYMSRFADAAKYYEEAVAITPKDATARASLADTYYWIPGRRQEAQEQYREVISLTREQLKIRSGAPDLFADLAYSFAALGERDSAAMYLEMAVTKIDPDSGDVATVFGIGETFERMGQRDPAVWWMSAALDRRMNRMHLRHSAFLADVRKDERMGHYLSKNGT